MRGRCSKTRPARSFWQTATQVSGRPNRRARVRSPSGFLADSDPTRRGSQSGVLASFSAQQSGGLFGVHLLQTKKSTGTSGTGFTVSLSQPLTPGVLDGYGEIGRGIDGETVATVGVYLAGLYQKSGIDAWVEAGTHSGYANALTLGIAKNASKNLTYRGFATALDLKDRSKSGKLGVGAIYRYH